MLVGVQFNQNLFAEELVNASGKTIPGTRVPEQSLPDLRQRLTVLKPQFVRMFFSPHQDAGSPSTPGTRESFIKTAELAQAVGATINITVQSVATYIGSEESREKGMNEFAAVLDELVNSHGIGNLRWVTLENEPNTPGSAHINPPVLNQMYRYLDGELVNRGLRSQIRFMAGDLIQGKDPNHDHPDTAKPLPASFDGLDSDWSGYTNQGYWVTWMEHNMADIVDAYSIHIYWNVYSDISAPPKFQQRLETIAGVGKPFYVTEFGVRGNRPTGSTAPGILRDGTPVEKSNQAAFQHAWFQIAAAQLNCAGTAKWDGYYAVYDATPQAYYAIGAPVDDRWACYPMYDLLWMLTNTIDPSWQPRSVPGVQPAWAAVAEFRGRPTDLTIVGLDTRGATTNEASEEQSTFTLPAGLPTGTQLDLFVWNDEGDGRVAHHASVPVDEHGEVTISIRQQGVFALTTTSPPLPGA